MGNDGEESAAIFNHVNPGSKFNSNSPSENGVSESNTFVDGVRGTDNRLVDMVTETFVGSQKDHQTWSFNRQLKILVTKEVKRPGRSKFLLLLFLL